MGVSGEVFEAKEQTTPQKFYKFKKKGWRSKNGEKIENEGKKGRGREGNDETYLLYNHKLHHPLYRCRILLAIHRLLKHITDALELRGVARFVRLWEVGCAAWYRGNYEGLG